MSTVRIAPFDKDSLFSKKASNVPVKIVDKVEEIRVVEVKVEPPPKPVMRNTYTQTEDEYPEKVVSAQIAPAPVVAKPQIEQSFQPSKAPKFEPTRSNPERPIQGTVAVDKAFEPASPIDPFATFQPTKATASFEATKSFQPSSVKSIEKAYEPKAAFEATRPVSDFSFQPTGAAFEPTKSTPEKHFQDMDTESAFTPPTPITIPSRLFVTLGDRSSAWGDVSDHGEQVFYDEVATVPLTPALAAHVFAEV